MRIVSCCKKCNRYYKWDIGDMNHEINDPELEYDYERAETIWEELQPKSGKKLESLCPSCCGREIRMFISRHSKSGVTYRLFADVGEYLDCIKYYKTEFE